MDFNIARDSSYPDVEFRIMTTTCPLCHKSVQFALNDEDYIRDEAKYYKEQSGRRMDEIIRLTKLLDAFLQIPNK